MKFLNLFFSFKGRISLKDFWIYWLIPINLAWAVVSYLDIGYFNSYPKIWLAIGLLLTWPTLATSAKRLHDINLSAWWLLLHLIPILGSIILFIQICFIPGTEGENRFDSAYKNRPPEEFKKNYRTFKIIVFILIIFQIICFFTNKSILDIIYTDGPYYGRVIDAETGGPIAGAAIAGIWEFQHNYIKTFYSFADAKETVSDSEGNFHIPRMWCFTPWIGITELTFSELYVFKSGYDSHPPNIYRDWTQEDEKQRNITKDQYKKNYRIKCKHNQECTVRLSPVITYKERVGAVSGAIIGHELPFKHREKIHKYIAIVNAERNKIGVDEWNLE